ncbi:MULTISPECIES: ABC transporter permease [unclassified Rhodococcus (in: high G+C Gram-positive bacteria)]|uniref:ABC transporter permease n=1 Tax=unclassified Rhodococcus (in: high G+C Gram-positive bacteria) TaxID=192944 RepID=UPI001C387B4C|nr:MULTISPECIES: ABC transporter permease [unclassified Rhodococcus (in: high G+C Gram-positive bacteria)]MDJ0362795.1 ABC transporter permease [Rhodococcus sp. H29-C3]
MAYSSKTRTPSWLLPSSLSSLLLLGSSLAAPVGTLPGWLQAWADINPVTHAMDGARALLTGTPADDSITQTLIWSAVIFTVFCPLAVRAYARKR